MGSTPGWPFAELVICLFYDAIVLKTGPVNMSEGINE